MYHESSGAQSGTLTDLHIFINQGASQQHQINTILSRVTGLPAETIDGLLMRDLYIGPDEAQKLGFIDEIIQARPRKEPAPRKTLPADFCARPERGHITLCPS